MHIKQWVSHGGWERVGGGVKGPVSSASASFVPLAFDLDRKQPSRAKTLAGQLKVQGGQTPQCLTSSFLMTLLTPAMGNTRSRGNKTTPPNSLLTSLLSPFCLRTLVPSLTNCCTTTRSANTCHLSSEARHMAFYCCTGAKKHIAGRESERERKNTSARARLLPITVSWNPRPPS